ncbi:unnamed protein product [Linum tenue]|uniref:Protein FRA10AC1 n=1 Tax=Linum tenue TaxID=586396 RepID=A0AAV0I8M5_9ROSI|nr:unnamed protein product [Linum tenue]
MASFGSLKTEIFDREARKQQYQAHVRGLNAYDRHKKFLNDYVRFYGKERSDNVNLPVKTDQDTIREGYRYCIADMSFYKSGKVNFSYFEAGENKQALVKLVACEKCAGKLNYRNRKEKEKLEKEKEEQKRKRERYRNDDHSGSDDEDRSKEKRRKGNKASASRIDHDDDDSFNEFLDGLFL